MEGRTQPALSKDEGSAPRSEAPSVTASSGDEVEDFVATATIIALCLTLDESLP
jgi:hypothetical protein